MANREPYRERTRFKVRSKEAAKRWGENRERELLVEGLPAPKRNIPTVSEFAPRFIERHARANRHKASGIDTQEMIVRVHLEPFLGNVRLDVITTEEVQKLKVRLSSKKNKTVNNVLTVLSVMLKKAVEWAVIERMPCSIELLKAPRTEMAFHGFDAYERLLESAEAIDQSTYLLVLLGGQAGLRVGEMLALQWSDVDFGNGHLCIQRSDWKGHIAETKSGGRAARKVDQYAAQKVGHSEGPSFYVF